MFRPIRHDSSCQRRTFELSCVEVSPTEVGTVEIGTLKVGILDVGMSEVGITLQLHLVEETRPWNQFGSRTGFRDQREGAWD